MKMITARQMRFLGHFDREEKLDYLEITENFRKNSEKDKG